MPDSVRDHAGFARIKARDRDPSGWQTGMNIPTAQRSSTQSATGRNVQYCSNSEQMPSCGALTFVAMSSWRGRMCVKRRGALIESPEPSCRFLPEVPPFCRLPFQTALSQQTRSARQSRILQAQIHTKFHRGPPFPWNGSPGPFHVSGSLKNGMFGSPGFCASRDPCAGIQIALPRSSEPSSFGGSGWFESGKNIHHNPSHCLSLRTRSQRLHGARRQHRGEPSGSERRST